MTSKREKTQRCDSNTCTHLFTMSRHGVSDARDHPKYIGIENVDIDHMKQHHVHDYNRYLERELDAARKEITRLQNNAKVIKVAMKQPEAAPVNKIVAADPANYVEGYCDAIFNVPSSNITVKCCEHVKYGHTSCATHLTHPTKLNKPAKPEPAPQPKRDRSRQSRDSKAEASAQQ